MKYLDLGKNEKVSCIGIGCMRIAGMSGKDVDTLVKTALDEGINFFDHADIYGGRQSEEIFGKLLAEEPGLREKSAAKAAEITLTKGEWYALYKAAGNKLP